MKNPKVSIITVTFNLIKNGREKSFRQCVESVHHQTYKNIEHLIIDGASTDGTLDLIKEYEDKGWLKCFSEPDKGMSDAMNKGIKKASGEFIAILNSDDYYTSDMVELSIKHILKADADYSYSDCDMIKNEQKVRIWSSSEKDIAQFFIKIPFNHETMLCKKSVYGKLNYYNWKRYGTACDIDFLNSLILNDYKSVYINKPLLQFRLGGTTNTLNPTEKKSSFDIHLQKCSLLYCDLWKKFMPKETHAYYNEKFKDRLPLIKERQDMCTFDFALYLTKFLSEKQLKNYPFNELFSYFKEISAGSAQLKYITVVKPENKSVRCKFLNFIPLFKITSKANKTVFYLFDFIPVMSINNKVVKSKGKINVKLFNIFPFFKIKVKDKVKRYFLLNMFQLFKIKTK